MDFNSSQWSPFICPQQSNLNIYTSRLQQSMSNLDECRWYRQSLTFDRCCKEEHKGICCIPCWVALGCPTPSSLAKVPIRFPSLPIGGFRQVFKLSANMRLTSFASYMSGIGVTGDVQIRVNITMEHMLGIWRSFDGVFVLSHCYFDFSVGV